MSTIQDGKSLRNAYLEYFRTLSDFPHPVVPSAPLVPPDDPTLLFTSAGMVQFKALYSGTVELPYPRAASCQKCLRAGGKGSDLENVGKTLRHHTFFEMLGNFSFGDYFKRETIRFAWEFCTSPKWMGLPKDRMFPTIYGPTTAEIDTEAIQYYAEETDCPNPLIPLDASENFWGPAGETGACGPCSEVKFFLGSDEELRAIQKDLRENGDDAVKRLGRRVVDEGDLFLEIWNMVFPQFDQQRDGTRLPLKNKGIDTGAGLERMTVALTFARTGKLSTPYETDLMWPITKAVAEALGVTYRSVSDSPNGSDARADRERLAVNAIADHVRTLVFCLAEGLTPGNVGRRYVIRRIQRRALRFASLLGQQKPFMADLYEAVVEAMGDAYPEIKKNPDFIKRALRQEEETFLRTRDRGMKILAELIDEARSNGSNTIPGEEIFRLWDTYGFPVDMTAEIAEDEGLRADMAGYEAAMKRQKEEAKKSWKGAKLDFNEEALDPIYEEHGATDFVGYEIVAPIETALLGIVPVGEGSAEELQAGGEALLVLRSTPFYAESGGQIGDTGRITTVDGALFQVTDTQKSPQGLFLHRGKLERGTLRPGATVTATIDRERRQRIIRNHSSVHLLQSALKRIVGDHITQAGSFVGPDSSRFDFTHGEPIARETLQAIQREVNRLILNNAPVVTEVLSLEEAKAKGAIAPFGEKYGAVVRVVSMGPESIEFCGGTHVPSTGYIARYRIVSEASIASGVRRIEAVTGDAALEIELDEQYHLVAPLQNMLAAKGSEALQRVGQLQDRLKELEREVARLKREAALREVDGLLAKATDLNGARVVVGRLDGLDGNELRTVAMALRDRLGERGVAALISEVDGKVAIVAASGKEAQKAFPAGTVVNKLAAPLGGKGGGKPDMAQAGAKDASRINEVISGALGLLA
jgi:alanyl-tRNA synthetase